MTSTATERVTSARRLVDHGVDIARMEWRCYRREAGWSRARRWLLVGVGLAISIALGVAAHSVARDLALGRPLPAHELWIAGLFAFVWPVWRSATLTHDRFSRLEPEMLLTTVTARAAGLGLLGFVFAWITVSLVAPTLAVACGIALGLRSPAVALTVVVAVAGTTALSVVVGVAGRLAVQFVGTRLSSGRFYRDLFALFGWAVILGVALVFRDAVAAAVPALAGFGSLSGTWFVDLALLGAGDRAGIEARHGLAALGLLVPAVALLAGATTVLVRRLWEAEPVGSGGTGGSHPLVREGRLDRLLENRISRPVRTVARERWLVERRAPRGLLNTAYVLVFVSVIVLPVFGIVGVPLLVLVAASLGLAAGVAFGSDPVAVAYRVFPMLLTTVGGRQFVAGLVLAAVVAGVPAVAIVVVPIGLFSSATLLESLAVVLLGVAVCACATTVAAAIGLGVDREALAPVPAFFTDIPTYAERGWEPFYRLAIVFGVVSVAGLPAALGNVSAVYEGGVGIGVPATAVRVGSLLLSALIAVAISSVAYRIAVRRYRQYRTT
ncbi:hypothetical protein [Natrinema versiforme]|uniref:Uncharacterized protein n=1 Tax=Natrinema versiforme TaxID=88724 RepID=A0A4P8WLD8_9EURY|nr:hypothetical protein [Natrinema versiforme]QCS42983.1 hypothetical protein FEJ81_11670 [Natrinema versiforme]